jgi:hypothetical protein
LPDFGYLKCPLRVENSRLRKYGKKLIAFLELAIHTAVA